MKKTILIVFATIFFKAAFCQMSHTFTMAPHTKLVIEKGDITTCAADAIVNAANEQLLGGAGVCGAIFDKAGWDQLQTACNLYPETNTVRCPIGQARITESFNLKSCGIRSIIHAVGPDCRIIHDSTQQDALLAQAYTNSLLLADQHHYKSIAFPFISSAIYAFPKERAASIAVKTIREYVHNNKTTISVIHFVLFSQDDFDLFYKTTQQLCSE